MASTNTRWKVVIDGPDFAKRWAFTTPADSPEAAWQKVRAVVLRRDPAAGLHVWRLQLEDSGREYAGKPFPGEPDPWHEVPQAVRDRWAVNPPDAVDAHLRRWGNVTRFYDDEVPA